MKRIITSLMLSVLMTWPVMSADQNSSQELPTKYKPVNKSLAELLNSGWDIKKTNGSENLIIFILGKGPEWSTFPVLCKMKSDDKTKQATSLCYYIS